MGREDTKWGNAIQTAADALAEPARVMLGYQDLVVEHINALGLMELAPDADRVQSAARELNDMIDQVQKGEWKVDGKDSPTAIEARIRHDLRTPLNAILGYSEMVLEELEDAAPKALVQDIMLVLAYARQLLGEIEQIRVVLEPPANDVDEGTPQSSQSVVSSLVKRSQGPSEHGVPRETGRILVIDDIASNRELLERRLGRDGHDVSTAGSGREALRVLEGKEFDLVLLDVLMPDMNGLELLERMKSEPRWRGIPVIMISGLKENDAVVRCIEEGAEDYLPKPFDPVLLRARIAASLERKQWRDREQRYLQRIEYEKDRADALLAAVLPRQIVTRLNSGEKVIADRMDEATILFADIVGFTPLAAQLPPDEIVERLSMVFNAIDQLAVQHGVEKIKTIGDAYMAAAGVPDPNPQSASTMVGFACDMLSVARDIDSEFRFRVGIHTGPVVAGLIGDSRFIYDVWGHTVNVASRLEAYGTPDRIMVSDATYMRLGGRYEAEPKIMMQVKGAGEIATYTLS
ncbi:MAG: response regulator [Rhizobiales bacterium]|nr:response regulator [Hyphomicrobiales bacterium]